MKRTPLYDVHLEMGGKMIDFGGWEMPVSYKNYGIIKEHNNVRENVSLFDVSHMGEIELKGPDAVKFADWLVPNYVCNLEYGQACYTQFCREDATIVDDLIVYKISDDYILLVVNAANKDKDVKWVMECGEKSDFDVTITDKSDEYAQIAVQGPKAAYLVNDISDVNPDEIGFYHFKFGKISDVECLISRTGYTGEDGFEIYLPSENADKIWRKLMELGKKYSIAPAGLGARDTLRLEGKLLLYGNEMDDTTNPVEAKLMWTVKKDKECFNGKDAIFKIKAEGVKKYIAGFEMLDRGIPRHGYKLFSKDGEEIGIVTSGIKSPTLGKSIGLAYIKKGEHKVGKEFDVEIRGKMHPALIIKTPFYKKPDLTMVSKEYNN